MKYKLFTIANCFHCRDIKKGLDAKKIKYTEIVCGKDELDWVSERTTRMIMPVMFDDKDKEIYFEDLIK